MKQSDGRERLLALAGGFLDISRARVTILADMAEFADEIDVDRAEAAMARARELLAGVENPVQREAANAELQKAQARLRVARGGDRS